MWIVLIPLLSASIAPAGFSRTDVPPAFLSGTEGAITANLADDPEILVGSEEFKPGDAMSASWAGYVCKEQMNGCPQGAPKIEFGNIVGCNTTTSPPGCTGICTACGGAPGSPKLCQRDPNPLAVCELADTGSGVYCGKKGTFNCGFVTPPYPEI